MQKGTSNDFGVFYIRKQITISKVEVASGG